MTSNSTEDYDRGEKLSHYQQCPSVSSVIFVSHRRQHVTVVRRTADGWEQVEYRSGQKLALVDPQLTFDVDELYTGIQLEGT